MESVLGKHVSRFGANSWPVGFSQSRDANNRRTTSVYDSANRTIATVNALGNRTTTVYDQAGRRIALIEARGNRTTFTLDAAGRETRMLDPLSNRTTYAHDADSRRTVRLDARGYRTTYAYDDVGRLLQRRYPDGSSVTFAYDDIGNRTLAQDTLGRYTTSYDALYRRSTTINPAGKRLTYTYDAVGQRKYMVDPDGGRFTTSYDADHQISLLRNPQGDRTTYAYVDAFQPVGEGAAGRHDRARRHGHGRRLRDSTGALGPDRDLTNAAGAITDTYLHDAWGVPIASTGVTINPFRYVGELGYYHHSADSYYVRARWLAAALGRWLSEDPSFESTIEDLFAYASNLPLSLSDPPGLAPFLACCVFQRSCKGWDKHYFERIGPVLVLCDSNDTDGKADQLLCCMRRARHRTAERNCTAWGARSRPRQDCFRFDDPTPSCDCERYLDKKLFQNYLFIVEIRFTQIKAAASS